MAEHQHQHPEAIFAAALEIADPVARAAYVEQTCGADNGLRQEVEMLLAAHAGAEAGDFMGKQPTLLREEVGTVMTASREEQAGDRIDRYKLLEPIGEGGFGVVWMAEQQEPVRRRVALKVIKLGMDTKQVVGRFEAERQALALMDHPNIARVFDGGATAQGRPYFVMELIKGVPITDYCDCERLDPRQRLELFILVCQGVQHAHQKGVIHRDLKPSNILVAVHDDKPVPKIIDFGIAKATQQPLTDQTVFTRFQQLVGTPAYMSPEQAGMSSLDVDTRSDVYSLGVLLYELLTGRTPFSKDELLKAGFEEMCRVIREKEPPKPSTRLSSLGVEELKRVAQQRKAEPQKLGRLVRGELDWIVGKAMEKDRTRRYETANGLARDIERYLNEEPVTAVAPSVGYQMAKFARRHRTALATAAAFAMVLLVASVISTWQAVLASRLASERDQQFRVATNATAQATASLAASEKARQATESALYANRMRLAYQAWEVGDVDEAERLLALCPTNLQHWEWRHLKHQCGQYETRFQVTTNYRLFNASDIPRITFLRDSDSLLVSINGESSVWDPASGTRSRNLDKGTRIPAGFHPGLGGLEWLLNWNQIRSQVLAEHARGEGSPSVANVDWLAIQTTNGLRVVQLSSRRVHADLTMGGGYKPVAISADGKWLAAERGTNVVVLGVMDGKRMLEFRTHDFHVGSDSYSSIRFPAGTDFAIALESDGLLDSRDTSTVVSAWNIPEGRVIFRRRLPFIASAVHAVPPDGLAIGGLTLEHSTVTVVILDLRTGDTLKEFRMDNGTRHFHRVINGGIAVTGGGVDFLFSLFGIFGSCVSADGRITALGVMDRTVQVLDAAEPDELEVYRGHRGGVLATAVSSSGERMASLDNTGEVIVWNFDRRKRIRLPHSPDSFWAEDAAVFWDGTMLNWTEGSRDFTYSTLIHEYTDVPGTDGNDRQAIATSRDGALIAAEEGGQLRITDRSTGRRLGAQVPFDRSGGSDWLNRLGIATDSVSFSADSSMVAVVLKAGTERRVVVYRTDGLGTSEGQLCSFAGEAPVAFGPDGRWLVTGLSSSAFQRLDVATGKVVTRYAISTASPMDEGDSSDDHSLAISPDGRFVLCFGRTPQLFDILSGQMVMELGALSIPDFSPDGRRMVGAGRDGLLHIWDLNSLSDISDITTLNYPTMLARFIGDGSSVLVISPEGEVTVLDSGPPSAEVLALAETQRAKQREREARLAAEREEEAKAIRRGIPARDPQIDVRLVDLSLHYTAAFSTNWHGDEIGNNLRELPNGLQRFGGVDFDVRGLVQAPEAGAPGLALPSTNLLVGQTCRRLHFLHAAIKAAGLTNGMEAGRYVVRYADGQKAEIPLRIGIELADWWNQPGPLPTAPEVWKGSNAKARREPGRYLRLFHLAWENPHPTNRVEAIDLVATGKVGMPFLVALTTE